MTYSCVDFVDTILDALGIEVPEEAMDDPSAQADLALAAIAKMKAPVRVLVHLSGGLFHGACATPIEVTVPFTEHEANWMWEHLSSLDLSHYDRRAAGIVNRTLTRLEIGASPAWNDKVSEGT